MARKTMKFPALMALLLMGGAILASGCGTTKTPGSNTSGSGVTSGSASSSSDPSSSASSSASSSKTSSSGSSASSSAS